MCSIEKLGFGNILCLSGHSLLFAVTIMDLESLLTLFTSFLSFRRTYTINSEIQFHLEDSGTITVPAEAAAPYFL